MKTNNQIEIGDFALKRIGAIESGKAIMMLGEELNREPKMDATKDYPISKDQI